MGGAAGAAFGNTDEEKQAYAAAGLMGGMLLGGAAMAAASKPRAAAPRPKWAGIELPEEGGIGRSNYAPRKFEFLDPLRQIFNPMGLSGHAEATGGTIRAGGARGARYLANARRVLGTMEARVQSLPLDQQVEVRNAADQWLASGAHLRPGQAAPAMPAGLRAQMAAIDPALPSMLDAFKEITDQYTRKLVEMGILEHTLDDYVGRSWMQAAELGGFEQGGGGAGKSKIEGSKTYTKARQRNEDGTLKYQTFGDGIKAGLTPRTYNLVTEQLHKFADMQRAIDGRLMMDTEVAAGRAKQVSQEDITKGNIPTDPDGKPWKPIGSLNDPAYTQKRVTPDGFLETKGRYYAPQDVAAVWNNHLARGLKGSRVYQMLATPGRAMAQTILGISGFHGVTTMTNGVFSELALGVDAAVNRGDLRRAAGSVGAALKSPRVDYKYGQQLVEQFADPSAHPDLEPVVRLMVEGGWRGDGANEFWKGDRKAAFQKSWKQAFEGVRWQDRAKGAIESPIQKMFQGVEWASRPIMEKYVPRMKAAALAMEISRRMEALPPDATVEQIRAVTGRAMTEMDARFGQVIYDNHFINKSVKDAMQLVMLAPGWTFGNINLMTRSAQNIKAIGLGALKGKRVPTNSATNFWIASFVGTAVTNAILTKVNNPDEPIMLQDLLAWRDGSKDKEGNWNRHTLPGYLMHDVYNYVHKSVDTHGVHPFEQAKATSKTMVNKLSPALRMTIGLLTNSDYAGNQIYGDLDSAPELLAHVGKYMAKGVLPISIASGIEGHNRGEGLGSYVAGAAGMSPAPREFVRTEAQNALADIARRNQGSSSPEESDHFQMMMKAHTIAENQGKDAADAYLHDLQDRGMVTPAQLRSAMKVDTKNPLAQKFAKSRGTVSDLEKVFNLGTPEEQALWAPLLRAKAARAGRQDILRRIEPSVPPE